MAAPKVVPSNHEFTWGGDVTPSNDDDLADVARALWIGVGGTLKVTTLGGQTITTTVPAGLFPVCCKRVFATGTAATGIVALR